MVNYHPMTTSIRAIIFDFGGVLVHTSEPVGRRTWEAKLGLAAGELEQVVHGSDSWRKAQCGLITPETYWSEVLLTLHLTEADLPALKADYFRDDRLDLDLVALIQSLRQDGYKIGVLSNDALTLEHKLRNELAIFDVFDAVIISAAIGVMKPDPVAYQAITEALGVAPQEAVFIDDNQENVEGARRFGMLALPYHAGMDLRSALQPLLKDTA